MKKLLMTMVAVLLIAVPAMADQTVTTQVTASIVPYAIIDQTDDNIVFTALEMDATVGSATSPEWVEAADTSEGTFQSNVDVSITFADADNLTNAAADTLPTDARITVTWDGGGYPTTPWAPVTTGGTIPLVDLTIGKVYTLTGEARVQRRGLSDPPGDYATTMTLTVAAI